MSELRIKFINKKIKPLKETILEKNRKLRSFLGNPKTFLKGLYTYFKVTLNQKNL